MLTDLHTPQAAAPVWPGVAGAQLPQGSAPPSPVVAVMQPYVFPYLGYFQLVAACDSFVFYDDVHHTPRGWVNRNRILINGAPHTFTVPVAGASQNRLIHELHTHDLAAFARRFLRQLEQAYCRAPQRDSTLALVQQVLGRSATADGQAPGVATLAMRSVQLVCQALGLQRRFLRSSQAFADSRGAPRAQRLIDITHALGARCYINSPGGAALYDKAEFAAQGVQLRFVQPQLPAYAQAGVAADGFVPGLSIIDVLMHNPLDEVARMVRRFTLD